MIGAAYDSRVPNDSHRPIGHVVARHPLLPLETLDAFRDAARRSPEAGRAFIDGLLRRPEVSEALYVASPGLMEGVDKWRREPTGERGQKVERALISYLQRMATRCTPFGLFASVSVGRVGKTARWGVADAEHLRRRTRLDNGYLQAVCEQLLAQPETRHGLTYTANETLHQVGERLHFVTARQEVGRRVYDLSAVDALEVLTQTILPAARVARSASELTQLLKQAMPELADDEASGFVDQLIDAQILSGSLAVPLTGREGLEALIEQLKPLGHAEKHVDALVAAGRALEGLDRRLGHSPEPYEALTRTLDPLGVPFERGQLVQVDLARLGDDSELPESLTRAMMRVTKALLSATPSGDDALAEFRSAFSARYEGAEVPLLEALDDEAGVGFTPEGSGHGAPLLKDLLFPRRQKESTEHDRSWEDWVGSLLVRARLAGGELVLTEQELEHRARRENPFPESFALLVTLFAQRERHEPVAALNGVTGPSSENLFGRFAWLDERLERSVREGLAAEEALRPEARFAELIHSPEGRAGNVIARPAVRAWEIPILSRGGLGPAHAVPLDDLLLSTRDGRLVLRSKSLGNEVVPRLTNAHNYSALGLPLYKFLAAMQSEGLPRARLWAWGGHVLSPALPRVRVGPFVVAAARWKLFAETLKALTSPDQARAVAKTLGWPRFVSVREGDNTLSVDLDNDLSVETFIDTYQSRAEATVEEDLDRLFGSPFSNAAGTFANELVIPMVAAERRSPPLAARPPTVAPRVFTPGSEWLYVRVHVSPGLAERVLLGSVPGVLDWAKPQNELKRWFFIRYEEQGHHLRLRFQGNPDWLRTQLWPKLDEALRPFVEAKVVSRVVVDTYRREVERYGGDEGVVLAESWFEADSNEALALLEAVPGDGEETRSWCAFVGVHQLLGALLETDEDRLAILGSWRSSIFAENDGDSALEDALSKTARARRALVAQLVTGPWPEAVELVGAPMRARQDAVAPLAAEYRRLAREGRLTVPLRDIGGALMHMHVNRLLRAQQRRHELVFYDLLSRHLRSVQGRSRKGASEARRG